MFHSLFEPVNILDPSRENRAAGELEGAKARLEYNQTPSEKLEKSGFSGNRILAAAKMRGGRSAVKKSGGTFLTS